MRCPLWLPAAVTTALLVAACGGAGVPEARPTGKLADRTFAGQNRCNPKNAERPFIIEWDATDQSTFQAHAASDVVVVRYVGCDLQVLEGCRDDSAKGSIGSYRPIEFTSGGLETIDIHDENELYAKLPLGAASLSGRVQTGDKLHMEYYVSGTRTATRDKVYRADMATNPRCKDATHFVYAYNLGAFALASQSNLEGQVDGSYFGFGAGAAKASSSAAEKKGGELAACKGDSAKEVDACKVPIRLTLRALEEGADPTDAAAKAPETDASLNLAGQLKATTDAEKKAQAMLASASTKKQARDGKGCLADLDGHDALDPRPDGLSTNPASGKVAGLRAECLMLAGQCDAGKALFRKALHATKSGEMGAEQMDKVTEAEGSMYCTGKGLSPRDEYLRAMRELTNGGLGVQSKTVAECQAAFDTFMKLRLTVKPKDASDSAIPDKPLTSFGMIAPTCFAKAGDCAAARKAYRAMNDAKGPNDAPKAKDDAMLQNQFDALVGSCKGK
jgi:hypothetical protein